MTFSQIPHYIKESHKYLLWSIVLYFFAFNPILTSISGIGTVKFLYPLLLFQLFNVSYHKNLSYFKKEKNIFIAIICYSFLLFVIGGSFSQAYIQVIVFIEALLLPVAMATLLLKSNLRLKPIMILCLVYAATITLLCLINPSFNTFIQSIQPANVSDFETLQFRSYGLSIELGYGYGASLGLMLGYFWSESTNNKLFWALVPFVIIAILVNARVGVLVVVVSMLSYILIERKLKFFLVAFVAILLIQYILSIVRFDFLGEYTVKFIEEFFYQIVDMLTGSNKASGAHYDEIYTGDMFVLPDDFPQWVIGRGIFIRSAKEMVALNISNTDIGFLLMLNYGGLIFVSLYITYYIIFLKKVSTTWLFVFFLVATILLNIKGDFFGLNGPIRVMSLMVIYDYLKGKHTNENL